MNPFGVDHPVSKSLVPGVGWRKATELIPVQRFSVKHGKPHTKLSFPDDPKPKQLPRWGVHNGEKKRVLGMHSKDRFVLLNRDDSKALAHRSNVTFTKRAIPPLKEIFPKPGTVPFKNSYSEGVIGAAVPATVAAGVAGGGAYTWDEVKRKRAQRVRVRKYRSQARRTGPASKWDPKYTMTRDEFAAHQASKPKRTAEERRAAWEAKGSPREGSPRQRRIYYDPPTRAKEDAKKAAKVAQSKKTSLHARRWIQPAQISSFAASGGGAAVGVGALAHRSKQRKEGKKPIGGAAGDAAIGAATGVSGMKFGLDTSGWGAKRAAQNYREKNWDRKKHNPIWNDYRKKMGFTQLGEKHSKDKIDATSPKVQVKIGANYPKDLPGARVQRALAFKNRPSVVGAAFAGAGALGGVGAYKHAKKVEKIAPRIVYHGTTRRAAREISRTGIRETADAKGVFVTGEKETADKWARIHNYPGDKPKALRRLRFMAVGPARTSDPRGNSVLRASQLIPDGKRTGYKVSKRKPSPARQAEVQRQDEILTGTAKKIAIHHATKRMPMKLGDEEYALIKGRKKVYGMHAQKGWGIHDKTDAVYPSSRMFNTTVKPGKDPRRTVEALGKSFYGPGLSKPITQFTEAERKTLRAVKGGHKGMQGATKADTEHKTALTNSIQAARGSIQETGNQGKAIKVKGGTVQRYRDRKARAIRGQWMALESKGGQRRHKGLIVAGGANRAERRSAVAHETTHATRRKPMSAYVRITRNPQKLWGDEARADSAMAPRHRAKTDYRAIAGLKDKTERQMYNDMQGPMYQSSSGPKKYKQVSSKLGTWDTTPKRTFPMGERKRPFKVNSAGEVSKSKASEKRRKERINNTALSATLGAASGGYTGHEIGDIVGSEKRRNYYNRKWNHDFNERHKVARSYRAGTAPKREWVPGDNEDRKTRGLRNLATHPSSKDTPEGKLAGERLKAKGMDPSQPPKEGGWKVTPGSGGGPTYRAKPYKGKMPKPRSTYAAKGGLIGAATGAAIYGAAGYAATRAQQQQKMQAKRVSKGVLDKAGEKYLKTMLKGADKVKGNGKKRLRRVPAQLMESLAVNPTPLAFAAGKGLNVVKRNGSRP